LREDGSEVESKGGAVQWGKTETHGEGGQPVGTDKVHGVIQASEIVENGGNQLLEESSGLVGYLAANGKDNGDIERTSNEPLNGFHSWIIGILPLGYGFVS